jgi:hypothetical protein
MHDELIWSETMALADPPEAEVTLRCWDTGEEFRIEYELALPFPRDRLLAAADAYTGGRVDIPPPLKAAVDSFNILGRTLLAIRRHIR